MSTKIRGSGIGMTKKKYSEIIMKKRKYWTIAVKCNSWVVLNWFIWIFYQSSYWNKMLFLPFVRYHPFPLPTKQNKACVVSQYGQICIRSHIAIPRSRQNQRNSFSKLSLDLLFWVAVLWKLKEHKWEREKCNEGMISWLNILVVTHPRCSSSVYFRTPHFNSP